LDEKFSVRRLSIIAGACEGNEDYYSEDLLVAIKAIKEMSGSAKVGSK